MTHPQRERLAAVFGGSQGSGYLLTPWLVLTAAHLIGEEPPEVLVPGGVGRIPCRVVWSRHGDDCDAALLLADRDLVRTGYFPDSGRLTWSRVETLAPRRGAHAIGFPHVQRDADGELDSEQLVGTLKPGSGLLRGRQVLDSSHKAPAPRSDGSSPWAGYSGAAVFHENQLVGVVRSDPTPWRHGRVELTSVASLLARPEFAQACEQHGLILRWSPSSTPDADEFEERLRKFIIKQSSMLHIIGLSQADDEEEFWPLDTSYLSLELWTGGSAQQQQTADSGPLVQRAEQALAGMRRVLVRGSAGSGKTTLLQWLATATARRALPPSMAHLQDCVPLLIRLRAITGRDELPSPEEFLALVARPLMGHPCSAGWVTQQLTLGRILLLIDGVDEVREADRARTRTWLIQLMTAYPDAHYIVTTRPSAVREGWLSRAGFVELELLPMRRSDVAAFITKWHTAASAGRDEDERLAQWRDDLSAAVVSKLDLGRLATSPLLCALICALNRDRRGYLPEGRMELYSAALEMLLVRRDRERGIALPDSLRLTEEHQVQLLQRLAYWLAKNGAAEINYRLAVRIISAALPTMHGITAEPSQVLDHLIIRSGLLRQPTLDSVDFIHRTFQDYLAARAAIEEEDLGLLIRNAHDDQWADVLRMAVGHARPRERAKLLDRLLVQARLEASQHNRLLLLATTCLEHASELDPAVRRRVETATAQLIPPRDAESARSLAAAGTVVLDLLPGPEGLDDETALAVVAATTQIADGRSLPLLAKFTDHPHLPVRSQLAWAWSRFDSMEYGEQIIARLRHDDALRFVVNSRSQLAFIAKLGGRPHIERVGRLTREDLELLHKEQLVTLVLSQRTDPIDLRIVAGCPLLRHLWLRGIQADLAHLTPVQLETLMLIGDLRLSNLAAISAQNELTTLALTTNRLLFGSQGTTLLEHVPASLRRLRLDVNGEEVDLRCGSHLQSLEHLELPAMSVPARARANLAELPQLRTLVLDGEFLPQLARCEPLPGIRHLVLYNPLAIANLSALVRTYPLLESLSLFGLPRQPLDLGQLASLTNLRRIRLSKGALIDSESRRASDRLEISYTTNRTRPPLTRGDGS